ncbi:MAG TPA: ribonuclease III [Acidimicrobiales bacterium]|nr:ribonuclease III [Acidimicrobiales bacterium]
MPGPLDDLARAVGLEPEDPILARAVTHSSYAAERGVGSNERLEFLGDAVVGLVIGERAYRELDLAEGGLAQVRQATVAEGALAAAARELGVPAALRLGRGEDASGGRDKDSVLADAYEAVIAAVYLDGGLEAARRVVHASLEARFDLEAQAPGASDVKSRLQEWAEARAMGTPVYEVRGSGPGHEQRFEATVTIAGTVAGSGQGTSKKGAELAAARAAWEARGA